MPKLNEIIEKIEAEEGVIRVRKLREVKVDEDITDVIFRMTYKDPNDPTIIRDRTFIVRVFNPNTPMEEAYFYDRRPIPIAIPRPRHLEFQLKIKTFVETQLKTIFPEIERIIALTFYPEHKAAEAITLERIDDKTVKRIAIVMYEDEKGEIIAKKMVDHEVLK